MTQTGNQKGAVQMELIIRCQNVRELEEICKALQARREAMTATTNALHATEEEKEEAHTSLVAMGELVNREALSI